MPLTAILNMFLDGKYTKALDLDTVTDRLSKNFNTHFANGAGASQVNLQFHDKRTLAAGASEDLDLAGGLVDAFGQALTFAKIKLLFLKNLSTTQTLTVGGAAANAWVGPFGAATHTLSIKPGGIATLILDPNGFAVTAGTGDLLKVLNSAGATCDYYLIIWGTSA